MTGFKQNILSILGTALMIKIQQNKYFVIIGARIKTDSLILKLPIPSQDVRRSTRKQQHVNYRYTTLTITIVNSLF